MFYRAQIPKIWAYVILFFIFFFLASHPVSAHTFLTDRDITVLLHTNPDDDPIVGQSAALLFDVTDSTGKFDAGKCDCNLTISKSNQVLFSGPLLYVVGASVYALTEPFTFPEKAVYQIAVDGKPKTAGEFQSFKVQYDLRVDRGVNQTPLSNSKSLNPWLLIGLLVVALGIFAVIYYIGSHSKKKSL